MRRVIALVTTLSFLFLPAPANAAVPKAGAPCSKANQSQTSNGVKFTCVKSGSKLIWKKSVASVAQSKPAFEFKSVCDFDPESPSEWYRTELFLSLITCTSFYKYVPYQMPDTKPTEELSPAGELANIEECKIKQPTGQFYPWRAFAKDSQMQNYYDTYASPRPKMVIQAMPISWPDLPHSGNPQNDYGHYFKFFEEWIKNSADNGADVIVKIPDKYYPMPKNLDEYKDIEKHGQPTPNRKIFWTDVVTATDPYINFSGTTLGIVIPAPNTPIAKFGGNPDGSGNSSEGQIPHILSVPPINLKDSHPNSQLATPHMWMHEMSHAGLDIGDYYNSGIWGSVGSGQLDQLGWDKYIEGFMNDAQIRCAPNNKTTTHWIAPSAAKGPYQKLVVVPLSQSKVIIVESVRSAGYNYKLPKNNQGALVYTVDVSKTAHGEGTDVYRPANRPMEPADGRKVDAPLKKGESITISGVKISVINTGTFGDVIKVEKA